MQLRRAPMPRLQSLFRLVLLFYGELAFPMALCLRRKWRCADRPNAIYPIRFGSDQEYRMDKRQVEWMPLRNLPQQARLSTCWARERSSMAKLRAAAIGLWHQG